MVIEIVEAWLTQRRNESFLLEPIVKNGIWEFTPPSNGELTYQPKRSVIKELINK